MAKHAVAQLGLKPSALGRHDPSPVRDGHQILDARRVHRKGAGKLATVDPFLKFTRTTNAAHECDAFAPARIVNPQNRSQRMILQDADVELLDRVIGVDGAWLGSQRTPSAVKVESNLVLAGWFRLSALLNLKRLAKRCTEFVNGQSV